MTQPFKITGPGFYQTRNGQKAEVLDHPSTLQTYPFVVQYLDGYSDDVTEEGFICRGDLDDNDLVAPWQEPSAISTPQSPPETPRVDKPQTPFQASVTYKRLATYKVDTIETTSLKQAAFLLIQKCLVPNEYYDLNLLREAMKLIDVWETAEKALNEMESKE